MSLHDMISLADDFVDAHDIYEHKDTARHKHKKFNRHVDDRKNEKTSEIKHSSKLIPN